MHHPTAGRWYFGWNIVAAASVLTLLTVGMRMSIGPFFLPIASDMGFSRSTLAGIVAVGMLFYGLGMPMVGFLLNRWGTRHVALLGTAIIAISLLWAVMATGPISFLLSFGILLSLGLAFVSPVTFTPLIARWFTRQRGAALFFLTTGSMAGIALMTPVVGLAVELWGWRATLIGYAIVIVLASVPLALWVMREDAPPQADNVPERKLDRPESSPQTRLSGHAKAPATPVHPEMQLGEAVRSRPFWQVMIGLFACGYSMNLLGTQAVPMLVDHGFDSIVAASGIGLIGLTAIFSTIVLGRLSDHVPRRNMLATIYFIRGLGFFGLVLASTRVELYTVAVVGGIVWAGSVALSSAILADVYGVRLVGILYGWAYLGHQIGGMISSWLGGWAYETYGSHWIAFGSTGIILFIAAAVSLRLPLTGSTSVKPRMA